MGILRVFSRLLKQLLSRHSFSFDAVDQEESYLRPKLCISNLSHQGWNYKCASKLALKYKYLVCVTKVSTTYAFLSQIIQHAQAAENIARAGVEVASCFNIINKIKSLLFEVHKRVRKQIIAARALRSSWNYGLGFF